VADIKYFPKITVFIRGIFFVILYRCLQMWIIQRSAFVFVHVVVADRFVNFGVH